MSIEAIAFSEIVNAQYPRFTRIAAKILIGDHAEVEDAVQEGLRKALHNLDQCRGTAEFPEWLMRIVINECLVTRRNGRIRSRHLASLSTIPRDSQHCPELEWIRNNATQIMMAELRHLPPLFRDVLYLHDVRELPMVDVASSLGIRLAAAKSRLQRARFELRRRVIRRCGPRGDTAIYRS